MANQYPKSSQQSRADAILRGEKHYSSATPCKVCGSFDRYVSSYGCVPCNVEKGLLKLANSDLMEKYRTREKRLNRQQLWRNRFPDKVQEQRDRLDRSKLAEYAAKRRAKVKNQTPQDADLDMIRAIYKEAARLSEETGIIHEVDHIVPISKGGEHHQENLQILTRHENRKKSNKG